MADELESRAVVDNEGMAEDYFSQYEEVDDEGNPTAQQEGGSQPQQGGQQQAAGQQPTQGNEQSQSQQGAGGEEQQPDTPQGFASRFYKQDEQGQPMFDADAAHGFLFNKDGPRFAYQPPQGGQQVSQGQPQQGSQQAQTQEEVPEWKKPFVERQKYEEQLAQQMLHPIQRARETLGQNADPQTQQFLNWQEQQAREYIRNELLPKWEYDRKQEEAQRQSEQQNRSQKLAEYSQKARINEAALAAKMGGEDAYRQFFFGQQVQGPNGQQQFQKGPATDVVNHLFQMQNPDKAGLQGQELSQAMNEWWSEFASNQQNLHLLYEFGLANLQRQLWPKLVDKIGAAKEQEIRGQRRAQTPQPSGNNTIPNQGAKPGTGHQALDQYLETI